MSKCVINNKYNINSKAGITKHKLLQSYNLSNLPHDNPEENETYINYDVRCRTISKWRPSNMCIVMYLKYYDKFPPKTARKSQETHKI